MAGLINELIEVLNKQAVNYDELLVLSIEKGKVIVSNDTTMLQKITQVENTIIGRNQKMENKRLEIIKDIASVLNQDANEMTIASLAEFIKDQPEYDALIIAKDELKKTLTDLKEVNDHNAKLLESSLDYIDFTINLVRSSLDDNSYLSHGKQSSGDERGFFDAKQ